MVTDYLFRGLACLILFIGAASARAAPPLEIQPARVRPGDALLISVHGATTLPEGTLGGRPLTFFPSADGFQALVGLSVDTDLGTLPVEVTLSAASGELGAQVQRAEVVVEEPNFRSYEISVPPRFISPSAAAKRRIQRDHAAVQKAFAQKFSPPLFTARFAWPRQSVLSGRFGDQRIFNGVKQSQHYGDDLQGAEGDPVAATNDGQVVLVRDCYYSGRTILVYHGAALYSAYFHLSRIDVRNGQRVKQGDSIGLVGQTGRATGPHLHWGMKLGGLYVNPESVLRLPFGKWVAPAIGRDVTE